MIDNFKDVKKIKDVSREFKHAIANYKPAYRAWPFLYGDDMIPIFSCASSFHITHYFRKELKLRPYAKWTCYTPVVGISALMIDLTHSYYINPDIIHGTFCAPCSMMTAALVQGIFSVLYPLILAPVITFGAADRLLTYPVPSLTRAPQQVFSLASKLVQKNSKVFLISAGIQMIMASFVTWQKQEFMHKFITEG